MKRLWRIGGRLGRRSVSAAALAMLASSVTAAGEDVAALLESYRSEAELSKITKIESAGVVDIFTRDMLEKMQAHTLSDVLKELSILNYTRTSNAIPIFSKPAVGYMPINAVRLYIDDHDMTASSFGSALLIWGDMPIEQIDHIEIYKGTSSIEFGNEAGVVVIRLYTKTAEREEGGKIRLMADDDGSYEAHGYYAHTGANGVSGFFYAQRSDVNRQSYENLGHKISSDAEGHLLTANLAGNGWRIDATHYRRVSDSFLGARPPYLPDGGDLDAAHDYIHATWRKDGYKATIAYDSLSYDRSYIQYSGIPVSTLSEYGPVYDYRIDFDDKVWTLQLEKSLHAGPVELLLGGFYKYKGFESHGRFATTSATVRTHDRLGLNLYSLYAEANYPLAEGRMLVASLKGDWYRYTAAIDPDFEWIARVGYMQKSAGWTFKLFWISGYLPIPLYELYSGEGIPLKTNPDLDSFRLQSLTTGDLEWRRGPHRVDLQLGYSRVTDRILYGPNGFYNSDEEIDYLRGILRYAYYWSGSDFARISWYGGRSEPSVHASPDYGLLLEYYDRRGDVDLFGAVHLYGPYDRAGVEEDLSYDVTVAVKYHVTEDLSVGLRGENIFGTGFRQIYRGFDEALPVYDRKYWINLEYLF